jgi:uncharacterized phiE125 gp8 family phage protein
METIKRVIAPTAALLSLRDVKKHLRVEHDDDDEYIDSLIKAATAHIDGRGELGRAMLTQTWEQWVTQSPGSVTLRVGPFQSLVSVTYYDTAGDLQTAQLSDFETRQVGDFVVCVPKVGFSWPGAANRPDAIGIKYVAGYGDAAASVPAGVRHAVMMLIAHLYENREAASDMTIKVMPMAVEMLLGAERVSWYG